MTASMVRRAAIGFAFLLATTPAWAEPRVEASVPLANATVAAPANLFEVRFNEDINHYQSRLEILRDGQVLETLRPRLETEPRILAAMARPLAAGAYVLRWEARSAFDGSVTQGNIPFTVR